MAGVAVLGAVLGGKKFGIANYLELIVYTGTVAPACDSLRDKAGIECLTVKLDFYPTVAVLFAAAVAHPLVSQVALRAMCDGNSRLAAEASTASAAGCSPRSPSSAGASVGGAPSESRRPVPLPGRLSDGPRGAAQLLSASAGLR